MLAHTTPRLCAAAANAGVVAFEGAGQLGKDVLVSRIRETQAMLNAGAVFGVNLFVPSGFYTDPSSWTEPQAAAVEVARERYEGYLSELSGEAAGTAAPSLSREEHQAVFSGQVDALLETGVKLVSFHFGWPDAAEAGRLREAGATLQGCATTVEEARWLVDQGADAIIAQGAEAGGHRGTFIDAQDYRRALVEVVPLVRGIADAVDVPVIAAGGIMRGGDIRAVLEAGASAAQLGTAFLSCPECGTSAMHREALLGYGGEGRDASDPLPTVVTLGYTGKPARGLQTDRALRMADLEGALPNCFNGMLAGRTLQAAALKQGRKDAAYLWAGSGYARSRAMPAAALVETLVAEAQSSQCTRVSNISQ